MPTTSVTGLFLSLSLSLAFAVAHAQEACISANPVIGAMQAQWQRASAMSPDALVDGFAPAVMTLLPLTDAEAKFGKLDIKSGKTMRFTSRHGWNVTTEGDYWIAADSGAWIDVLQDQPMKQTVEPLTFNHGLRCAGIYKALKFHLQAGSYTLLVASDQTDQVKISAGKE